MLFGDYGNLPVLDQFLHSLHFVLCALAVLVAIVPLKTEKGSFEHKAAGFIYLPLSAMALCLGGAMAWREASLVLFCFDSFCAYLLLSGWRAVHEKESVRALDWAIPLGLLLLGFGSGLHAAIYDEGKRSLYLIFFAVNAFYLGGRDVAHLRRRRTWQRQRIFFAAPPFSMSDSWMSRHVAGMVGSMIANLSVVVLTLLPLGLHWLWPVMLIAAAFYIARQQKAKRRTQPARVLNPAFGTFSKSR